MLRGLFFSKKIQKGSKSRWMGRRGGTGGGWLEGEETVIRTYGMRRFYFKKKKETVFFYITFHLTEQFLLCGIIKIEINVI